jgi:hypothetical protein
MRGSKQCSLGLFCLPSAHHLHSKSNLRLDAEKELASGHGTAFVAGGFSLRFFVASWKIISPLL